MDKYRNLGFYISKNVIAILFCWLLTSLTQYVDFTWSVISAILVLSPAGNDAPELAFTRIKANLVGVTTGILLIFPGFPPLPSIVAGCIVALAACELLNLSAGARSAVVAMIIIMLHREGVHVWDGAVQRLCAVITGCIAGLLITWLFHSVFRIAVGIPPKTPEREA